MPEVQKDRDQMNCTLSELFYILYFVLMLIVKGIGLYDGQPLYRLCFCVALVLMAARFLTAEYTTGERVGILLILLLTFIVWRTSGEKGIVLCVLLVLGLKDIRIEKIMRIGAAVWTAVFCGNFVVRLFDLKAGGCKVHEKLGLGQIIRWSFGYSHPNVFHISYLILAAFALYVLWNRLKLKHILILMAGNLIVFFYSVSYTGVLAVTALLLFSYFYSGRKCLCIPEKAVAGAVFPAMLIMSVLLPLVLTGRAFEIVNKLMNTRLALAKIFLQPKYMTLFGNRLADITDSISTMDSSYVYCLVIYGIPVFLIMAATYFMMITDMIRRDDLRSLIVTLFVLMAGFTEPFLFNTSFKNITLLFLGAYLNRRIENSSLVAEKMRKALITGGNRKMALDLSKYSGLYRELRSKIYRNRWKIIAAASAAAFAAVLIFMATYSAPSEYITVRSDCSGNMPKIFYYMESADDTAYPGAVVLRYVDSETIMYRFAGNAIRLEFFRGIFGSGVSAFVIVFILLTAIMIGSTVGRNNKNMKQGIS